MSYCRDVEQPCYCYHTRAFVERLRDTLVTLGATTMRYSTDIWVSVEQPTDKVSATTVSTVTLMKLQYVLVAPMVKLVTFQHHLDAPLVPLSHYTIFLCPHCYPSATKVSLDVSTDILTPLQYLPMSISWWRYWSLASLLYLLLASQLHECH